MKIKIWGTRGSIPAPISSKQIEEKLYQAILGMPSINTKDPEAVQAYIKRLPPMVRGTAGGNTPCIEVQADGQLLVLDAGSGLYPLGLELMKGPFGKGAPPSLHQPHTGIHQDSLCSRINSCGATAFYLWRYDLKSVFEGNNFCPRPCLVVSNHIRAHPILCDGTPLQHWKVASGFSKSSPETPRLVRSQPSAFAAATHRRPGEREVVRTYIFLRADALIFDAMHTLQDTGSSRGLGTQLCADRRGPRAGSRG